MISLASDVSNLPGEYVQEEAHLQGKEFCSRHPDHLILSTCLTTISPHPEPMQDFTARLKGRESVFGRHFFLLGMLDCNPVLISFLPTSFITVLVICLVEKTKCSIAKDKVGL